jgi:CRP-like cAMP-binding protein
LLRQRSIGASSFLIGSPGHDMVTVVSGTIRISMPSHDGKEIVVAILGPGNCTRSS